MAIGNRSKRCPTGPSNRVSEEHVDLQNDSEYIVDQLRRRMDASDRQREQAISKQSEAYEKAIDIERDNRDRSLSELKHSLTEKVEAGDRELLVRIQSIMDAGVNLASERDRAAEALRSATQRAIEQAEIERAKSADRLAEQLGDRIGGVSNKTDAIQTSVHERINEGDQHLRQHIDQQVLQIQQALEAARRETAIIHDASTKAIEKAESSTEKRFEAVGTRLNSNAEQAAMFMPREVADTQIEALRKQIQDNTARIDTTQGARAGSEKTITIGLAAATIVISIVVVLANVLLSQM